MYLTKMGSYLKSGRDKLPSERFTDAIYLKLGRAGYLNICDPETVNDLL